MNYDNLVALGDTLPGAITRIPELVFPTPSGRFSVSNSQTEAMLPKNMMSSLVQNKFMLSTRQGTNKSHL